MRAASRNLLFSRLAPMLVGGTAGVLLFYLVGGRRLGMSWSLFFWSLAATLAGLVAGSYIQHCRTRRRGW